MRWIRYLVSDSNIISTRRVIGLIAFLQILVITEWALLTRMAPIVSQALEYCFYITLMAIFAVSATSVVAMLTRQKDPSPGDQPEQSTNQ